MKTIEVNLYQFDELSETAQNKAIEWYQSVAIYDEWWDGVYTDAENIGLKITEFDLDRNRYAKGTWMQSADYSAIEIVKQHGENCETYKIAQSFISDRVKIYNDAAQTPDGEWVNEQKLDNDIEYLENEFEQSLLSEYAMILQREMDYINSREQIIESIKSNEYDFTEDGKRF
jgi:hypothetical protein